MQHYFLLCCVFPERGRILKGGCKWQHNSLESCTPKWEEILRGQRRRSAPRWGPNFYLPWISKPTKFGDHGHSLLSSFQSYLPLRALFIRNSARWSSRHFLSSLFSFQEFYWKKVLSGLCFSTVIINVLIVPLVVYYETHTRKIWVSVSPLKVGLNEKGKSITQIVEYLFFGPDPKPIEICNDTQWLWIKTVVEKVPDSIPTDNLSRIVILQTLY